MGTIEENAFLQAGEDIMEKLGEAATFYPSDAPAVSCTVHLDEENQVSPEGFDLMVYQAAITIEVLLHEIGRVPKKGEKFVIGSYSYPVRSVISRDEISVKVEVSDGVYNGG